MTVYCPELHTAQALQDEVQRIHLDSNSARLHGSIGRSILYGAIIGNPNYEFDLRSQDPLQSSGTARDIDIAGLDPSRSATYTPFELDTTGMYNSFAKLKESDGSWFLTADRHDFTEELHPDVMRPVAGEGVLGILGVTLPPQTLASFYGLKGHLRPKDELTKSLLVDLAEKLPSHERFDEQMLEPFNRLRILNQKSWYIRTQDMYRRHVPETVRIRAVPFMARMKKHLL